MNLQRADSGKKRFVSPCCNRGLYFAVGSVAMTVSTMLIVWLGNGGHHPLTIGDAYIYFADWPMVLLHGIDFEIASGQSLLVNAIAMACDRSPSRFLAFSPFAELSPPLTRERTQRGS